MSKKDKGKAKPKEKTDDSGIKIVGATAVRATITSSWKRSRRALY